MIVRWWAFDGNHQMSANWPGRFQRHKLLCQKTVYRIKLCDCHYIVDCNKPNLVVYSHGSCSEREGSCLQRVHILNIKSSTWWLPGHKIRATKTSVWTQYRMDTQKACFYYQNYALFHKPTCCYFLLFCWVSTIGYVKHTLLNRLGCLS